MREKLKEWITKNKEILLGLLLSFGAGIATSFSLVSRRNRGYKQYIKQLENGLSKYTELNQRLKQLNTEFESRLENIGEDNNKLREQNEELRELNRQARIEISLTRSDIERTKDSIRKGSSTTEQISEIGGRLRTESKKVEDGISRLERLIERYGTYE